MGQMIDEEDCEVCKPFDQEWIFTYGDLVTLLFCFFVLLVSLCKTDVEKIKQISASFKENPPGSPFVFSGQSSNLDKAAQQLEKLDVPDDVEINASDIQPTVTWGITPGQGVGIDEMIPEINAGATESERDSIAEALEYMKFEGGSSVKGKKIDVAFLGSCTNGRLSDLKEVAQYLKGHKVAPGVQAIVVPGSQVVASLAAELGLDKIFTEAGFEWRGAGCSMCLAMNPDKLIGDQLCASSSNRNFKGRQGSPTGRTMLMSPLMVAAAAVTGEVSDARSVFTVNNPVPA